MVPDIKHVARFSDHLVDGQAIGSIPVRVIKHVKIRRRGQKRFLRTFRNILVFLDDNPPRVTGEWVELQLEHSLSRHGARGDGFEWERDQNQTSCGAGRKGEG